MFQTDWMTDAVFSLKFFDEQLAKVEEEPLYWKWALIALHNALHGFMVAALYQADIDPVLQDGPNKTKYCPHCGAEISSAGNRPYGTASEWREWAMSRNSSERKPQPKAWRMLSFLDLFQRIRDERYMERLLCSKKFEPSATQIDTVKSLNDLRNEFVHFEPKFCLDSTPEFAAIVREVLPIISFLTFESQNILWHDSTDQEQETKELLQRLSDRIIDLQEKYLAGIIRRVNREKYVLPVNPMIW